MANRTVKEAKNVHGTNPQYLIEKIIRSRIYDSKYWKEQCFALTAELLVDKAMELRYVGGVYGGNIKPTQFLCLTLKMLQIQPEKDIVVEFIKNEEFKYVRALGAFYLRLTGSSVDCYKYLEPLYNDNRKLRRQNRVGHFEIVYMDEFIDELLRSDRVSDIILPRIQKRAVLEENNELDPKVSALDEDLEEDIPSDNEAGDNVDVEILKRNSSGLGNINNNSSSNSNKKRERSRSKEKDKRSFDKRRFDREEYDRYGSGRDRERDYDREKERQQKERNRERDRDREFRERRRYDRDRDYREDKYERERDYYDDRHSDKDKERRRDRRKY